jgi:hypothetical protein
MADRKVHLVESKSFSTDVIGEDLRLTGKERFRKIEHPIHQWRMSLDGCFTCLSSGLGRCGIPTNRECLVVVSTALGQLMQVATTI